MKVKDVAREYVPYFESILEMEIWNLKQAIIPLPKVTSVRNFSKRRKCHECNLGKCRRSGVQFRHRLAYLTLIEFYSFPFETLPNVEVKKKKEEELREVSRWICIFYLKRTFLLGIDHIYSIQSNFSVYKCIHVYFRPLPKLDSFWIMKSQGRNIFVIFKIFFETTNQSPPPNTIVW